MRKSITDLSSVTTVGLDLAKHVFQVHGVDALGRVVVAKAIRRNKLLEFFASLPPWLVGLEARASCFWVYAYPAFLRYAAHSAGGYWARILPQASEIAS